MELVPGVVYEVRARNFKIGIYAGDQKFIGIRTKFGHQYLDIEYLDHTVTSVGAVIGEIKDIQLTPFRDETVCKLCQVPVFWTGPPAPAPWQHVGGTRLLCDDPFPQIVENTALFDALQKLVSEQGNTERS